MQQYSIADCSQISVRFAKLSPIFTDLFYDPTTISYPLRNSTPQTKHSCHWRYIFMQRKTLVICKIFVVQRNLLHVQLFHCS